MNAEDLIYKQFYTQLIGAGVRQNQASAHASMGIQRYRKGQFQRVDKLISELVRDGKKLK